MSDWISPILVKELRQGLRARAFEGAFILMQLLMLFSVLMAVMAVSSNNAAGYTVMVGEGFFWAMLSIPVLLVMPMRGCNSLRSEIDGKSLELIFLTRLSAWRIVLGKWAALFGQTCLLVVAVLPYAVLRYYLGSVDLFRDVLVIGILLGASGLLTALTVSLSGFNSKLARSMVFVFPIAILLFGPSFVLGVATSIRYGGASPALSWLDWKVYLAIAFYGAVVLVYLLEIGAERIAPIAENHAVRKRLLGVALLVSGPVGWWIGGMPEFLWFPFLLLLPVCVDALCRTWAPVPGNLVALRRTRIGRLFTPLLLPGWPSGFLYTGGMLLASGALLLAAGEFADEDQLMVFVTFAGAVLFPLACIRLVAPRVRRVGMWYAILQLAIFILTLIATLVSELFNLEILRVLCVFPLSTLMLMVPGEADADWLFTSVVMLSAGILIVLIRSAPQWNQMREILRGVAVPPPAPQPAEPDAAP